MDLNQISTHLTRNPLVDLSTQLEASACVGLLLAGNTFDTAEILFIKRALIPGDNWAGQIALPGGKKDPQDPTHLDACLREVHEEVGLTLTPNNLLGRLDDIQARKQGHLLQFYIRPFVFYVNNKSHLSLDPREVHSAWWLPLAHLTHRANTTSYAIERNGAKVSLPGILLPTGDVLWGLTYMIMMDFFDKLDVKF